jgi:hypothetical protein
VLPFVGQAQFDIVSQRLCHRLNVNAIIMMSYSGAMDACLSEWSQSLEKVSVSNCTATQQVGSILK